MKMNSLKIISVLALIFGIATAHADMKTDRTKVNTACSQDAVAAGCGSETVGKGLLKCLHTYKKEHKDFKFSNGCKSAMKTLRSDRKEMKEKK